jgi:hypothetical protein
MESFWPNLEKPTVVAFLLEETICQYCRPLEEDLLGKMIMDQTRMQTAVCWTYVVVL